jgi:TRAP-type uncharacterized transport system substrate-binding protein
MGRLKIRQLTPRALSALILMILSITGILFWVSYRFVRPFPPNTLMMATGREGGSYAIFGERYRQVLAREGVRLEFHPSSGAVENLRLLRDESQRVDAGFVQGEMGKIEETSNLVSLGNLTYTPLWVFYRGNEILDDLSQLKGKRIVIGPEGSGIRKFALELLKAADASGPPTELYDFAYTDARQAMVEGRADVVMLLGSADNHQLVLEFLHAKDIKLMNFSQAEAYTRLFPDLSHVILPRGVINPSKKFPPSDIHLLSPTTNLIVRKSLHPALVYLLLKASVEIHSGAGWVNKAGEFPSLNKQDDPISEQAQRFHKSGGSLLYDYLPFWAATFIDRMLLILIPLGIVIIPLIGIMPWIYTSRNRSKYYHWYHELRDVEKELTEGMPSENVRALQSRLDRIEEAVGRIRVSVAFYDEVFTLEEHIQMVRQKLIHLNHPASKKSDDFKRESSVAIEQKD